MKKIIGLSLIGFLLIGLTTALLASEHIYPLRDHPEFENYVGTEPFDQWHEEMLDNRPAACIGESYRDHLQDEDRDITPGQGTRRGNGLGYGKGNSYGRGMMRNTYE